MIKKPDVVSDEEIKAWIVSNKGTSAEMVEELLPPLLWSLETQRDADVGYYEPLIKEMYEALKETDAVLDLVEQGATIVTLRWGVQGTRSIIKHALAKAEGK